MGDKFDEILAKSQRLTTQLGIDDEATIFSQPLRRGINELESSRNIGIGTKRYFEEKDKLNAVRLLAQKNFDAVKLSSEVHDIAVETPYDPTERLEGVDLDGYLAHHHDMIVLNAIDDTNRITENYVKYTQRKRLVDEWQVTRRTYIESLGNVTQHWSKKPSATAATGTGGVRLPVPQSQLVATTSKLPTTATATTSADVSQLSEIMQKQSAVIRNLHSSVKLLNTTPSGSTFNTITRIAPLTQLAECVTIPVATTNSTLTDANGLRRTDLIGYKSVLEMMAEMVGEAVFDIVPSGLFSPLCFGSGSGSSISGSTFVGSSKNIAQTLLPSNHQKKHFLSLGAKKYLERQQLKTVTLDIDDSIQKGFIEQYGFSTGGATGTGGGMMTGGSGSGREGVTRKQRLKSFVYHLYRTGYLYMNEIDSRYIAMMSSSSGISGVTNIDGNVGSQYRGSMSLSHGTTDNTSGSGKMIPVWPFIYYCLTCGDIAVAIDELKSCVERGVRYVESDIVVVLQYFQYFIYKFTTLSQQPQQQQSASTTATGTSASSTTTTTDYVSKTISSLMTETTSSGSGTIGGNDSSSSNSNILTPAQSQEFYNALANCKELFEREMNDYNLILTTNSSGSGDGSGSGTGREGTAGASTSTSVIDPYRLLVLNLVSLSDKTALSDPGIATQSYTLQNYLWANIWFIVYERYTAVALYGTTALSSGGGSSGGSDKVIDIGENWLYNTVLDYGGDTHFDPAQNNPLKYVTVLLVCHRFGDAIRHLWHTSKTLPAVHLAVACLHYGLILPHLPLNQNPIFKHASTMQNSVDHFTTAVGGNNSISNNSLPEDLSPSAMLQFFFNQQFQVLFPEIAVDYLLCLNSNWLPFIQQTVITSTNTLTCTSQLTRGSRSSIDDTTLSTFIDSHVLRSRGIISSVFESLLINTAYEKNALARLVGEPQTAINEKLNVGYLHDYLDREMVNLLLVRCAYVFLTVKQEVDQAVSFYCLSGRLMDALEELCAQLSRIVIIPNAVADIITSVNNTSSSVSGIVGIIDQSQSQSSSSQERTYWITQCVQFYDAYVSTGVGPLFTCLQQKQQISDTSNKSDLIPTFLLLLNLSLFINAACVSKNVTEAVVLLEEITILPSNNDQLKSCVVMINSGSISNYIMSILDDVLLISMYVLIQTLLLYQQEAISSVLLTLQHQNELRMKMGMIQERILTLVVFSNNISTKLNRVDTQRIISRMEANINQQLNIIQRQQQLLIMQ